MTPTFYSLAQRSIPSTALNLLPWACGVVLLGILLAWLLPDGPVTHSFSYNRVWAYQFASQFEAGQYYPRWLEQSFGSLGSPAFVFYPPLAFYASLPFHLLGFSISHCLTGSMALATILLGAGVFSVAKLGCLAKRQVNGIAFLAAAMAMTSPYLLENIFVRGSLGEVWAMAFIPWLLYGIERTLTAARHWWIASIAYAGIAFSHPAVFLMITACLPLIILTLNFTQMASWRNSLVLLLALISGGLLASIYLLPAFFDRRWVILEEEMFHGEYNPLNRFLWGWSGDAISLTSHYYDQHLLPLLLIAACILILGSCYCIFGKVRCRGSAYVFILLATALFMVSDLSAWIYRLVPLLQKIQFTFRWLAIVAPVLPIIWARLLLKTDTSPAGRIIMFLLISVLFASVSSSIMIHPRIAWGDSEAVRRIVETRCTKPETVNLETLLTDIDRWFAERPSFPTEIDKEQPLLFSNGMKITEGRQLFFDDAHEYLPKTARLESLAQANLPLVEWAHGNGDLHVLSWEYGRRSVRIIAEQPGEIVLRAFDWPGWRARLNDQPAELRAYVDGRQSISVGEGDYTLELDYVGSRWEQIGAVISAGLLTLLGSCLLAQWLCLSRRTADKVQSNPFQRSPEQ